MTQPARSLSFFALGLLSVLSPNEIGQSPSKSDELPRDPDAIKAMLVARFYSIKRSFPQAASTAFPGQFTRTALAL